MEKIMIVAGMAMMLIGAYRLGYLTGIEQQGKTTSAQETSREP